MRRNFSYMNEMIRKINKDNVRTIEETKRQNRLKQFKENKNA